MPLGLFISKRDRLVGQDVIAVPYPPHVLDDNMEIAVPGGCKAAIQPIRIAAIQTNRITILIRHQQVEVRITVAQNGDLGKAAAIERNREQVSVASAQTA